MTNELVFTVHPGRAAKAEAVGLNDLGLRERSDLQEWVRLNPEILGEDVLILTFEFSAWKSRAGVESDRLDLLGLDSSGRLVVAELKRGIAPDTVEMQAIKYAAYASRFTAESLAQAHAAYLSKVSGERVSADEAIAALEEHVDGEIDPELLRRPRIVLLASGFPEQVKAAAVWLSEMGVDVSLVQFGAYRTEHDVIMTVSQLWPLPEVEDFTVSPRVQDIREVEARSSGQRETRSVIRIVEGELLEDGTELTFNVAQVRSSAQDEMREWLAADPTRGQAVWRNDSRTPLQWRVDGSEWSPTGLAKELVRQATGRKIRINGPRSWAGPEGVTLSELAGSRRRRRGWSDLHAALAVVRPGEWTTYGDLAEVIGSEARPVGQHVVNCEECPNAYRVLTVSGEVAKNFSWGDPNRDADPQELLESEGIPFEAGLASPEHRVDAALISRRAPTI